MGFQTGQPQKNAPKVDRIIRGRVGTSTLCALRPKAKIASKIPVLSLLRGAILNKTYGTDKNLYISLFLPRLFGPTYYYGPP